MGTKKPEMAPSQPTEYPNLVFTERLPHEIESLAKRALLNPDHDFTANTRAMMNSGQQVRAAESLISCLLIIGHTKSQRPLT